MLTIHEACRPFCCVIFAIILAAGILTAIFIDIVASYLIWHTVFVSVTYSYALYCKVVYRCKFDVMSRTGLSHNV